MRLALILCACVCEHAPPKREVETVTLHSITMYDVWLWEQSGDYEEGYTWQGDEPEPELFGPAYYYPEDELEAVSSEVDPVP